MTTPDPARLRVIIGAVFRLAVASLAAWAWSTAMWSAWLSWDREKFRMDGIDYAVPPGTYRLWQLAGCALSIATGAILGSIWVRRARVGRHPLYRVATVVLLTSTSVSAVVVPWTQAVAKDPTQDGLFLLGALMFLVTGSAGLGLILALADLVGELRHRAARTG